MPSFLDSWGQTVVVNNRPGGGSTIGTNVVATAAPDGHTFVTTIAFAINAGLQKLPYDPVNDFAPITELASLPLMLAVAPLPATNCRVRGADAIEPGAWHYASRAPAPRRTCRTRRRNVQVRRYIDLVHVPYKAMPRRTRCCAT
jgi:tripartite-type tricarboxylate transporter receptor subunit TctC